MTMQERRVYTSISDVPESLRVTHRVVKLHERRPIVASQRDGKNGFRGVVLYPGREQSIATQESETI